MASLDPAPSQPTENQNILQRFFSKVETFVASDENRWIILFVFVLASYVYMFYQSYTSSRDDPEKTQMAYLLNPNAGGYRVVRGDMSSPSLFKWDAWEYTMFATAGLLSLVLFYKFVWQGDKNTPWYIRSIEFVLAWTHSVLLLFFLPVNDFHKRMLYNMRSVAATVCNDALKELWLAFLFIVLLPLPGSRSHSERMTWMTLKLGVFYIAQNIMLGSPNYKVEPYTEGKILPESSSEMFGYAMFILLVIMLLGWEHFSEWKTTAWTSMDATQKRTRIVAAVAIGVILVSVVITLFVIRSKSSSHSPPSSQPEPDSSS